MVEGQKRTGRGRNRNLKEEERRNQGACSPYHRAGYTGRRGPSGRGSKNENNGWEKERREHGKYQSPKGGRAKA